MSLIRQARRDFGKDVYAQHQESVQAVVSRFSAAGNPLRVKHFPRRRLHRVYYPGFHVDVQTTLSYEGKLLRFTTERIAYEGGRAMHLGTRTKVVEIVVSSVNERRGLKQAGTDAARRDLLKLAADEKRAAEREASKIRVVVP